MSSAFLKGDWTSDLDRFGDRRETWYSQPQIYVLQISQNIEDRFFTGTFN